MTLSIVYIFRRVLEAGDEIFSAFQHDAAASRSLSVETVACPAAASAAAAVAAAAPAVVSQSVKPLSERSDNIQQSQTTTSKLFVPKTAEMNTNSFLSFDSSSGTTGWHIFLDFLMTTVSCDRCS